MAKSSFYICRSISDVKVLVKYCKQAGLIAYDYETNAKPIYNRDFTPTILSICYRPGFSVIVPLNHFQTKEYCEPGYNWKKAHRLLVKKVFLDDQIEKVGWNIKFDNQVMVRTTGFHPMGLLDDGMLEKYLLDEVKPHGLKEAVQKFLPDFAGYQKANDLDKLDWDKKPLIPLSRYAGLDTDCTYRLHVFFVAKLIKLGLYGLYRNLYMTSSRLLTEVEANGILIDKKLNHDLLTDYSKLIDDAKSAIMGLPKVQKFQKKYNQRRIDKYLESLDKEIRKLQEEDPEANSRKIKTRETKVANIRAGIFSTNKEKELIKEVNLGSNIDLPELMYSKSGFHFPILEYTDSGKPSTAEDTLIQLKMTVPPDTPKMEFLVNLLKLRAKEKMYKTYILGWSEKVQDDGCIHGRFNLQGTESGRLSSAEPNIQQIPKTSVDPYIKKQVLPKEGTLYFEMDFSQAELRFMAHLSGDETYLRAFANDEDPHLAIAAKKYGVPYAEAYEILRDEEHPEHKTWSIRRKQAKQIAFGIIYGIQAKLLSEKLSDPENGLIVTPEEAQQQLDEFFAEHPKIKKFMKSQEKFLIKHGYVQSLFGNRRRLPEIYSDDFGEAAYAVRLSVNMPCQGAASHMTLFGAVLNYWDMKQGKFPSMEEVATVHDAVYYNTKPEYINVWTVYKLWDTFRNPKTKEYFGFSVDDVEMSMDFSIGRTMAEELKFIPGYDYRKMLDGTFDEEEYHELYKKYRDVPIRDYPKKFKNEFNKGRELWINRSR